jgi:hypothetical protein
MRQQLANIQISSLGSLGETAVNPRRPRRHCRHIAHFFRSLRRPLGRRARCAMVIIVDSPDARGGRDLRETNRTDRANASSRPSIRFSMLVELRRVGRNQVLNLTTHSRVRACARMSGHPVTGRGETPEFAGPVFGKSYSTLWGLATHPTGYSSEHTWESGLAFKSRRLLGCINFRVL